MNIKLNSKNRKKILIALLVVFALIVSLSFRSSLADSKKFTRTEMQDMVVATALSYEYNKTASNYEQKSMDNDKTSIGTTFSWRYPNNTPEMVNRANHYNIDCSSFTAMVYLHSLGYDFSEYYKYSNSKFVKNFVKEYSYESKEWFNIAFQEHHRGVGTEFYTELGKEINNVSKNKVYKPDISKSKNMVAFHWRNVDSKSDITSVSVVDRPSNYQDIETQFINTLQKGDIVIYRRYNTEKDKIAGHAMLYVGDAIHSDTGLIHSTGYDYDHDSDPINTGEDDFSVRYDGINRLKDYLFASPSSSKNRTVAITILRPINRFYDSSSGKFVVSTLNENAEAREKVDKLRVEQYARVTKATTKTSINGTAGTARKSISKYNAVNKADTVEYSLYLENKSKRGFCADGGGAYVTQSSCEKNNKPWKTSNAGEVTYKGLVMTNAIPTNTSYVENSAQKCKIDSSTGKESCSTTTDCSYNSSDKIIKCNIEDVEPNEKIYYRYKVNVTGGTSIENSGMNLKINSSNTLKLSKLKNKVHPTYGKEDIKLLHSNINKFKSLISSGKIKYDSNSYTGDKTNLDSITSETAISQLGFIRSMYYNTFGIDIDYVTSDNIKSALFDKKSGSADYARKTTTETDNLTNEDYKNINKMLVSGMYGGRYLRGNDRGDRPGILRVSDLEVGDIVVYYYKNSAVADSIASYLFLGKDTDDVHYFARYTSDGVLLYSTATSSRKSGYRVFKELYSKNLFAVLRPMQMYGTTIKYDANGGSAPEYYTAYGTYKNLATATKANYTLTLQYNKTVGSSNPTKITGKNTAKWYSDKNLTNEVTNSSKLVSTSSHTLYAKWSNTSTTLPDPKVNGYNIEGWYNDTSFTNKAGNPGANYNITATKTLYAKWQANEYQVKYDPNGGIGSMENTKHKYGTSKKLSKNTFTREGYVFDGWSKTVNGDIDYVDEQSVKNLSTTESDVTLYAIWTQEVAENASISVEVEHGKTTPAKRTVVKGEAATFTVTPSQGYENPTVSCTNGVTASINGNTLTTSAINENSKCTVVYSLKKYSIKYNANGGMGTMSDSQFDYNQIGTLAKNTFTRDGYEFIGWSTTSDGNREYIDEEMIENLSENADAITLYAVWETIDYNISYELNGGTLSGELENYTIETDDIVLPYPEKDGYEFAGWTGSNGESLQKDVTIVKGSIGDKNYVANWKDAEYTITYAIDSYGTITGITEEKVGYKENPTGTTKTINEGYYHLKWAANKNVVLENEKTPIKAGAPISEYDITKIIVKEDITLTAYHYKTKYIVKYEDGNNGTISGIESEEVAENGTILGTEVSPKKGWQLSHWVADKKVKLRNNNEIEAGNPIDKEQINEVIITENISFRAEYDYATFGITYESDENGALTGIAEESKVFNENPTGSSSLANEDYFFLGWMADVDVTLTDGKVIKAGNIITDEQLKTIVVDDDIVFTAIHAKEILIVYYKSEKGITITGDLKEDVKYGLNPIGTKVEVDNKSRKVAYIIDKDVVLKDGKKITSGTEITEEQLKQVVVTEDLIVTAKYQKEEIVTNIPDTAEFSSIISVLGGLMFVSFGFVILYTTILRKRYN